MVSVARNRRPRLSGHAVHAREQARLLPPIQIETTGQPISIADSVTSAIMLAVVLTIIAWLIGRDPTKITAPKRG